MSEIFTDEHREVLQEVTNIGMGQAGDTLARVLGTFVELSIPRIKLVEPANLADAISDLINTNAEVTAVRQAFFGHWLGEAITVYDQNGCSELAELLGYPKELDSQSEIELFLDVGNLQTGACLNGVSELLGAQLNFSPPSILAANKPAQEIFSREKLEWSNALLLEVNFHLENHDFKSNLMMMLTETSIKTLCRDLENFLEQI